MALGNATSRIYLSVADGKIVQRVQEGASNSIARTKTTGEIVHERRFGFITGYLVGISISSNTFNGKEMKDWRFEIVDGEESYILSMMYDSRYAQSLLNSLCNPIVDFTQPITITPWMKVVNDKKKTSCYLKNGENEIPWFFTKDEPNGLPELKEVQFQGKTQWDSYERMQYFEKMVQDKIKPNLVKNIISANHEGAIQPEFTQTSNLSDPNVSIMDDDDLPF